MLGEENTYNMYIGGVNEEQKNNNKNRKENENPKYRYFITWSPFSELSLYVENILLTLGWNSGFENFAITFYLKSKVKIVIM